MSQRWISCVFHVEKNINTPNTRPSEHYLSPLPEPMLEKLLYTECPTDLPT